MLSSVCTIPEILYWNYSLSLAFSTPALHFPLNFVPMVPSSQNDLLSLASCLHIKTFLLFNHPDSTSWKLELTGPLDNVSTATPTLWMGILEVTWHMGRFGVRTSVSWLSRGISWSSLCNYSRPHPCSGLKQTLTMVFLSLGWLTSPCPLEKFPFELKTHSRVRLLEVSFITRVSHVLLGTPTAVFGTSIEVPIPPSRIVSVCILSVSTLCNKWWSFNQCTLINKHGGERALLGRNQHWSFGVRRASCCPSPSPTPALWPQASHVLYLSLGHLAKEDIIVVKLRQPMDSESCLCDLEQMI